MNYLTLKRLSVNGPGKKPAELDFRPGLNAIVGASGTGKTYVFQVLDHLLGGDHSPKANKAAKGYDSGTLEISVTSGVQIEIERTFGSNVSNLTEWPSSDLSPNKQSRVVAAGHVKDDKNTVSGILLSKIGLDGHKILFSKSSGDKHEVTFNTIMHLAMIDEIRIIAENSPAYKGQIIFKTREERLWNLFLTGLDDANVSLVPQTKKERNLSLDAKIDLISQDILAREMRLKLLNVVEAEIEGQSERIETALQSGTETLVFNKAIFNGLEIKRRELWTRKIELQERLVSVHENLARFKLLLSYYETDTQRLTAVIEAGASYERLSTGNCAVCGSIPNLIDSGNVIEKFNHAATSEVAKVRKLASDLSGLIVALEGEEKDLAAEERLISEDQHKIDKEIENELKPKSEETSQSIRELVSLKGNLDRAKEIKLDLEKLRVELDKCEAEKKKKIPKAAKQEKVGTSAAAKFCEVVERTLKAWKFPFTGNVAFDPLTFDIVIGDQDRGSFGKGHRAVTFAAFVVSLMRYCRAEGRPHPGFVVLDSPLNPFRGNEMGVGLDAPINDEVKEAFYEDLANDTSGDQFIIFENIRPPSNLRSKINYIAFSGDPNIGRPGFIPN